MAPSLQGLNIVHPQTHHDNHDLLAGHSYPDLSAQLDLWTNLAFDDDGHDDKYRKQKSQSDEVEEEALEAAVRAGHVNVVAPTNIGSNSPTPHPSSFDLNAFLAGFGIDPYSAPQVQNQNQVPHSSSSIAPSLAQLIALHAAPAGGAPFSAPATAAAHTPPTTSTTESISAPPAKRTRTRKASVSTVTPADSPEDTYREDTPPTSGGPPVSAAEDKRRRNTAASARFRLKKKEREAALEGRAKELETRVNELERECEGLRRENGWLKGLVVGVTGAAQAPVPATQVGAGVKRGRDEE
ncbi:hypothetical protein DXG03_004076 [Asterophora parasitica]|uniref:BZIP domain-containing protein n=1 Tax=Asterophora parasitica TaxID=117018 RepID=A0A9P7GB23_9AGAR|nr:hypothetical protein DXG03_004076 [Asterophora parasitica]